MRLRRFLAGTTGLTFVLLLIGVFTKEVGADLTCGMNWPLCDGAVFGLFPATLVSFIEWFHRLIALVVGLLILMALYRAWQSDVDLRVTRAMIAAAVLLPLQAGLGALTVLKAQLFTTGSRILIEPLISVAHFGTGVLLFTALVAATLWAYEDRDGHGSTTSSIEMPSADD